MDFAHKQAVLKNTDFRAVSACKLHTLQTETLQTSQARTEEDTEKHL